MESLRERILALKPCRVAVVMVAAGLVFLLFAPQAADVVRALAEQHSADGKWSQTVWFFLACLAWSLSAWYWARVMLLVKFPEVHDHDPRLQALRNWTPRILGAAAALGVSIAFWRASLGYEPREHAAEKLLLQIYSAASFVGAILFLVLAWKRRRIARAVGVRGLVQAEEVVYARARLRDLPFATWACLAAALAASFVLLLVFIFALQSSASAMGSAAILLLAASGWIAAGSTLDFAGMRSRVPVFSLLVLYLAACSFFNDNHAVRTLDAPQAAHRDLRETLADWIDGHKAELARSDQRIPMYLVDAEGGGIRAAYWTASVLGHLQNRQPCFADHLFSLSGVSGGSLGASVFVALLSQSREAGFDFKAAGQAVLSEDFLSPVVAAMLYPDLLQRFIPWPIRSFDRGAALERAWEYSWQKHVAGRNRMREPLDALWENKRQWTPALFLNATWVETGKRLIASNVRIAPEKGGSEDFVDTEDAERFFAPRSLPLATAAHMSARFTYVSPAGALVKDGKIHGRVVDGGYFENSGATTTLEILKTIDQLADDDDPKTAALWKRVEPYVIHISNEPVDPALPPDTLQDAPGNRLIGPKRFLNEVLSPLRAMLKTRDARGAYARETVMWQVTPENFLHFGLCRRSSNPPLGWVLSGSTRQHMEAQLTVENCVNGHAKPIFDNNALVTEIDRQLGGSPAAPGPKL